jgi:phosphopantothenoylcysteine decarboxylase/phosphopantothenate--cysteine ligase
MGFSIAEEAFMRGADVTLISGPTRLEVPHPGIHYKKVVSAAEMQQACKHVFPLCDIVIMAAAVADYTPSEVSNVKLKKKEQTSSIELKKTTDILEEFGKKKKKSQLLVGFALESGNGIKNAGAKLKQKNLDLIILNSLDDTGAGFEVPTNKVTIIGKKGVILAGELKDKRAVAADILNSIKKIKVNPK